MTTPWTTPTSFVNGVVIGATDLNQQVRDNMSHLKSPPFVNMVTACTGGTVPVTTATTAVPITGGLSAQLTTYGAPVQVYLDAPVNEFNTVAVHNLEIDGTAYTNLVSGIKLPAHIWVTGLESGQHTFVPTWQITGGIGASAVIAASAKPLIFWVREG